jgi:hypothetical protein
VLNLIFALIFFKIGDAKADDYDMFSHFGAVMFAAISAMFGSVPIFLFLVVVVVGRWWWWWWW